MIASATIISLLQKVLGRLGYSIKRRRPVIRRAGAPGEVTVTVADLMHAVHGENIGRDQHFGDDWGWSGVRAAVERFAAENQLPIRHLHDKWILG